MALEPPFHSFQSEALLQGSSGAALRPPGPVPPALGWASRSRCTPSASWRAHSTTPPLRGAPKNGTIGFDPQPFLRPNREAQLPTGVLRYSLQVKNYGSGCLVDPLGRGFFPPLSSKVACKALLRHAHSQSDEPSLDRKMMRLVALEWHAACVWRVDKTLPPAPATGIGRRLRFAFPDFSLILG